jgi:hypothetical protein
LTRPAAPTDGLALDYFSRIAVDAIGRDQWLVSYDEINYYPIAYSMTPSVAAVVRPLLPHAPTAFAPPRARGRGRHGGLGPRGHAGSRSHDGE